MRDDGPSLSRRALWSAKASGPEAIARPLPWTDAATLAAACTRCGACVSACPEHIIVRAENGMPGIDFHRGECTFCGAGAAACPAPVFARERATPWTLTARIGTACLAARGIVCQSCRDSCAASAIRFVPRRGGAFLPAVVAASCTGCGACVGVCPSDAITMSEAPDAV